MYAYINGIIHDKNSDSAISDVNGVGYLLLCSKNTLDAIVPGETCRLYVHMAVSQDNISLYGFYTEAERDMFRLLISVSRIGSRTALSALSALTPADIAMAIVTENAAAFDPVPGMGRKTAARILLELKEKVPQLSANASAQGGSANAPRTYDVRSEAIEALIALGYDGLSAGRLVGNVDDSGFTTVEELIKLALASMPERSRK